MASAGRWKRLLLDFIHGTHTVDYVRDFITQDNKMAANKLKSVQFSKITLGETEKWLRLSHSIDDPELGNVGDLPMSQELVNVLRKIDHVLSRSGPSEANIRMSLNMLLIYAHDMAFSGFLRSPVSITTEKTWAYGPILHSTEKIMICGKPDYVAWYGEKEEIAVNVLIVEAKTRGSASNGFSQCLAYMGIVHNLRKEADKRDCTVYGTASDGEIIYFLKIDNNSQIHFMSNQQHRNHWSCAPIWSSGIDNFLKAAAVMSPNQSKRSSNVPVPITKHMKEQSDSTTGTAVTAKTSLYSDGYPMLD
ncbi:hypothetical protein N7495_009078 [Penicillium taxi]|uniref:uncharacterized protein n=1 Tax=Penicillium taxi TaxID=168475 RepID=UPI0025456BD5|nr:uncharacterized protein N7495_009078 [Penicillium taxi]KAJ5889037.1 hypothetical protein N7495_009078 [Penicillium taxi]